MFSDTDQPTCLCVADSLVDVILLTSLVTYLMTDQLMCSVLLTVQWMLFYYHFLDMFSDMDHTKCLLTVLTVQLM
jgi:hypothetical protein